MTDEEEDTAAAHGEDEHTGLLPTPERIETMDRPALIELRDLLADWRGPAVEDFRARVNERLADTDEDEGEGRETLRDRVKDRLHRHDDDEGGDTHGAP